MTNYLFEHIADFEVTKPSEVYFDKYLVICVEKKKIMKCKATADFSNKVVFDVDKEPYQIRVKDEKALVRFEYEIRIKDSETFSKVMKLIPHGGDICIVDEFFLASRCEAFSIYDFNGNILEYIPDPFLSISCNNFHGLDFCNGILVLTTTFKKIVSIDLS
jgi:hypothetical protein